MPPYKCSNGKWRIGTGPCMYKSKASAESAYRGYLAKGGEAMSDLDKVVEDRTEPKALRESMERVLDAEAGDYCLAFYRESSDLRELNEWETAVAEVEGVVPILTGRARWTEVRDALWREVHIGFKKLQSKLAARGAKSPAALTAWIGARKELGSKQKKGSLPKKAYKALAALKKKGKKRAAERKAT